MTFFVDEEPLYRKAIGSVLRRGGAELVAGAPRNVMGPDGPLYYNSIFLFSEDGEIRGRYDKQYPVPSPSTSARVDFLRHFRRARVAGGPARALGTPDRGSHLHEGMLRGRPVESARAAW
jgi:predicted amidohydrolase